MSVRRNLLAAVRWIVPVVIVVASGSAPPLHAQSEGAPAPDNQPVVTSPAATTPIPVPRPSTPSTTTANRSVIDQAIAAAKNGDWSRAQRLAGETGSRPAMLFVEWLYLTDRGTDASF